MSWKKLSTRKVFEHARIEIYEDIVELPSGHQTDYIHFGSEKDVATIIAVNEMDKILLQREYSYPQREKLFQFPGGAIEDGETSLEGAARELAEEGQLKGELKQIGWFFINNRRSTSKMYVFVATNLQPTEAEKDIEEEFEDFWLTPDEINELIRKNKICNYSTLSAWTFFINNQQHQ
ncbi:MAG: NUDIX hydrolase [Candidatus Saccharimonadales bacterium]